MCATASPTFCLGFIVFVLRVFLVSYKFDKDRTLKTFTSLVVYVRKTIYFVLFRVKITSILTRFKTTFKMMYSLLHLYRYFLLFGLFAFPVSAQFILPKLPFDTARLYYRAKLGYTFYSGDTDGNPRAVMSQYVKDRGYGFGGEIGYRFSKSLETGWEWNWGLYPQIEPNEFAYTALDKKDITRNTWTFHARYIIAPESKNRAYISAGTLLAFGHYYNPKSTDSDGNLTFRKRLNLGTGFTMSIGYERQLSEKIAAFVEFSPTLTMPDDVIDSADYGRDFGAKGDIKVGGDLTNNDFLAFSGLGIRYNRNNSFGCVPAQITGVNGAERLFNTKAGTFVASVNENATAPVEYYWDFGDKQTAAGKVADHLFEQPGVYTVTFSAKNCGGTETKSLRVVVLKDESACEPVFIRNVNFQRDPFDGITVSFNAEYGGTFPINLHWDFGDGYTSDATNPRHTYAINGLYKATLTAKNCSGEVQQSVIFKISPEMITDVGCTGIELKSVNFNLGNATLDENARRLLLENTAKLRRCARQCVAVTGFTDHTESGGATLAARRAQTVRAFYIQNGIGGSRIRASGFGRATIPCENEDIEPGCRRNRRAESVSMRCGG